MLRNVISLSEVGQKVELAIVRDGKEKNVMVELDAFPDEETLAQGGASSEPDEDETLAGVTVREMTDRMRAMMEDLPEDVNGLVVTNVAQTSNAAREGLAEGDIIIEVGREPVTTLSGFKAALGKNTDRPVFLRVYKPRQGQNIYIAVPR